MITLILLTIIYLAFISLGLPDSLLGVAWPSMQVQWSMPIDAIGLVSMTLIGSTIISSFMSERVINRFGTGKTTFISCALTASALIGISFAPSFLWLLLLVIPLGLGGGAVDAALNNYVALHFKAHHMNWLHSFWGVGATVGPLIMARALLRSGHWQIGYRTVGSIQFVLMFILFFSLPLWNKHKGEQKQESITRKDKDTEPITKNQSKTDSQRPSLLSITGLGYALATFLLYCSIEHAVGLWGSSYLVQTKGLAIDTAAKWVGFYYGGITMGRFLSGGLSFKLNNTQLIRLGMVTALSGTVLIITGVSSQLLLAGFIITGIGLAPIFPSMLHATPRRFGQENSQRIIGIQMGFAYIGSAFLSPLWGPLLKAVNIKYFPLLLTASVIILILSSERLIKVTKEV